MNYVDATVTEMVSHIPYFKYNKYWVTVKYVTMGIAGKTDLMFNTNEEARLVTKGYEFKT